MHISNICTNDLQKKKIPKLKTAGAIPTKRYKIFGQEIACSGIEMVKIAGSWENWQLLRVHFIFGKLLLQFLNWEVFPFVNHFYTCWRSAYM